MKTCFKCGVAKPVEEFYRQRGMADGLMGKCKRCTRGDVRNNRAANRDRYLEYDRGRNIDPRRVDARRQYSRTTAGKATHARATQKNNALYPAKRAARVALNNALRAGSIIKKPCERCGNPKSQGHHPDYSKPLEVIWLCAKHHREEHVKQG